MVIITLSLVGTDTVHDYVRWPIKFTKYKETVESYKELQKKYKLLKLDFWTTVSALNICDFDNIVNFAEENKINHHWAFLKLPDVLNVKYKNLLTLKAKQTLQDKNIKNQIATDKNNQNLFESFVKKQDTLRNIKIRNYFNFDLK